MQNSGPKNSTAAANRTKGALETEGAFLFWLIQTTRFGFWLHPGGKYSHNLSSCARNTYFSMGYNLDLTASGEEKVMVRCLSADINSVERVQALVKAQANLA